MKSNLSQNVYQNDIDTRKKWLVRMVTLTVWMCALLCAVYWGLKFTKTNQISATAAAIVPAKVAETQAVAQFLGVYGASERRQFVASGSTNLVLQGIANTDAGGGVALIAVEGKPAKAYRVGSEITEMWKLKSLSRTGAILVSSKSNAEELPLTIQAKQPTTGIIISTNPAHTSSNSPRLPLPIRQNATDQNSTASSSSNTANLGAVASVSEPLSTQPMRAVSKYANQDTNTSSVGPVAQVERLNAPLTYNQSITGNSSNTNSQK